MEIPIRLSTSAGAVIKDVTIANIGCVPAIIAGGAGPGSSGRTGVLHGDNATGNATGNTISNFLGAESCESEIDAAAGAVTIGANTFPDPPDNEQNVRDNRP